MKIQILYEDNDIILVDKPSGFTVNKAETTAGQETVQDWAEEKLKTEDLKLKTNEGSDFYSRGGVVHRLDKETSGILIIAKTPQAFENLQGQFKERMVEKTYIALVHGLVAPSEGEISIPVGRLPWNRKRFGVVAGGRESVTHYKTISNMKYEISKVHYDPLTLLELYPKTGRTHQIRVHLKHLGHPIFADELYSGRKQARSDRKVLPRMFLHAAKISFTHPTSGERVTFESKLPEELDRFLATLAVVG